VIGLLRQKPDEMAEKYSVDVVVVLYEEDLCINSFSSRALSTSEKVTLRIAGLYEDFWMVNIL
jgi:hypothetical protein